MKSGTYSVTLIATNETGADTTTSEDYITVTDATPPVASFSASSTTVEIGDIVTFTGCIYWGSNNMGLVF